MTYPDFSIGGPIDPPGLADGSDRVPAADADGFVRYHLGDAGIFFGLAESRHVDSIPAGDVSYQVLGTAFTLRGFFLSGENLQIEADGSISGEIDSFRFFAGQEHYVMGNDFRLAFSSWQGPVRWEIGGAGTGKELSDLMVDAGSAGEWRDLVDSGGGLVADWATGLHRLMRD